MVDRYIKATFTGKGFITHADQETQGLSFSIMLTLEDNVVYLKVTGEEAKINTWKSRVSGVDSTLEEIESLTPPPPPAGTHGLPGMPY